MRLPTTPTTTLWRDLRDEARSAYRGGRVILAVDGTGPTATFADGLAEVFAEAGSAVFRASIADFQRPRAEYARTPEGLYRDAYDDATFRRVLIDPFREGSQTAATTGFQLAAFDARRDAPVESAWVTAPKDAVLIVDGPFLHRADVRGIWHWSVWLDVPLDLAYARRAERDGTDPNPDAPSNRAMHGAEELYLRDTDPRAAASAIVDDSDPMHPARVFRDYC